jgi:hypothetical protein
VDLNTFTIADRPNVKFAVGSNVFALTAADANHPSAAHCAKNALP